MASKNEYFFEMENGVMSPESIMQLTETKEIENTNEYAYTNGNHLSNYDDSSKRINSEASLSLSYEPKSNFLDVNMKIEKYDSIISENTFESLDVKSTEEIASYNNVYETENKEMIINYNMNSNFSQMNSYSTNQYDSYAYNENLSSIEKGNIEIDENKDVNKIIIENEKDLLSIQDNVMRESLNNGNKNYNMNWEDKMVLSNSYDTGIIKNEALEHDSNANGLNRNDI